MQKISIRQNICNCFPTHVLKIQSVEIIVYKIWDLSNKFGIIIIIKKKFFLFPPQNSRASFFSLFLAIFFTELIPVAPRSRRVFLNRFSHEIRALYSPLPQKSKSPLSPINLDSISSSTMGKKASRIMNPVNEVKKKELRSSSSSRPTPSLPSDELTPPPVMVLPDAAPPPINNGLPRSYFKLNGKDIFPMFDFDEKRRILLAQGAEEIMFPSADISVEDLENVEITKTTPVLSSTETLMADTDNLADLGDTHIVFGDSDINTNAGKIKNGSDFSELEAAFLSSVAASVTNVVADSLADDVTGSIKGRISNPRNSVTTRKEIKEIVLGVDSPVPELAHRSLLRVSASSSSKDSSNSDKSPDMQETPAVLKRKLFSSPRTSKRRKAPPAAEKDIIDCTVPEHHLPGTGSAVSPPSQPPSSASPSLTANALSIKFYDLASEEWWERCEHRPLHM